MNISSPRVAGSRTTTSSAAVATTTGSPKPSDHYGNASIEPCTSSRPAANRAGPSSSRPRRRHAKTPPSPSAAAAAHNPPPPPDTSVAAPPTRVVYGPGTIVRLPTELGRLCLALPLIVASPSRLCVARLVQALVPNLDSRVLDAAVVCSARAQAAAAAVVDDVVERAASDRDCVISVGGASAVGLARAVSVRRAIPHICIPTTYSGSEALHLLDGDVPTSTGQRPPGSAASSSGSRRPPLATAPSVVGSASLSAESSGRASRSRDSSGRSVVSFASRDAKRRVKPAVIIYDEELTASAPRRIMIPASNHHHPPNRQQPPPSDNPKSQSPKWSFMQLPGL